jgi:hypothetical protein
MSTLQFSLVATFHIIPPIEIGGCYFVGFANPAYAGLHCFTASTAPLLPLTTKLTRSRHSPDCSGYPCRGAQDSSVKQVAGDWQIPGSLLQIMVSTI